MAAASTLIGIASAFCVLGLGLILKSSWRALLLTLVLGVISSGVFLTVIELSVFENLLITDII